MRRSGTSGLQAEQIPQPQVKRSIGAARESFFLFKTFVSEGTKLLFLRDLFDDKILSSPNVSHLSLLRSTTTCRNDVCVDDVSTNDDKTSPKR